MADKSVKLKLTLSDKRIIESNAFTLPQGPAGPATLPNYVSFEKPTSISVNASGGERTVTGVAEWEAAGAMESGEYHLVDDSPLLFLTVGTNTNAVVGGTVLFVNSMFNRVPHINETCTFTTTQPDSTKVIWTGKCIEVSGNNCRFQVIMFINLGGGTKKYLHRMRIYGTIANTIYKITLNFVCSQSSAFIASKDFSDYLHNNGFDDIFIPCNGYMQNNSSETTKKVLQFFSSLRYMVSVYNSAVLDGYVMNLDQSLINEGGVQPLPPTLGVSDNVVEI
mgnify:CR=1 FL=1